MEHACYQCDAAVEDGVAFCSQCKAPQIRVVTTEALSSPDRSNSLAAEKSPYPPLRPQSSLAWTQALPAAFLGLLITTLLSTVLRGALGIGLLASGFLSVYFFRRRNPFARLTLGLGARLGALAGILGFGITAIATAAAMAVLHSGGEIHALMLKAIQQYGAGSTNPQMAEVLEFYASRQGFVVMLALGSVTMLILFLAVSSVGGMLGAAALKRKDTI